MKKFVISSVAVASFAFAFVASAATAADMGSVTLRQGSRGASVIALQSNLNTCAGQSLATDGVFGKGTAAAVRAFQSSQSLKADALVGNATKSALTALCAGTTGTTGNTSNLPAGCTSTAGYSPVNGAKCDSGSTSNGALTGNDARLNKITLRSENDANAGAKNQKVASFEVDLGRQSGDVELNRVDLEVVVTPKSSATEGRIYRMIDNVSIADASGKVLGSVRTSSRSDWLTLSTSGTTTGTISISGLKGIAKGDARTEFQVLIDAAQLSESDLDIAGSVTLKEVRYTEATGISSVENGSKKLPGTAAFAIEGEDSSDLRVTKSTNNPKEHTIAGSKDSEATNETLFVFNVESRKVDAEIDTIDVSVSGTAVNVNAIKKVKIFRGSTELASASVSGTTATLDLRDYALRADRSEEFTVKVDLAKVSSTVSGTIGVTNVDVTVYDENDTKVPKSVVNTVEHSYNLPVATKVSGQYVAPNEKSGEEKDGYILIRFEAGEAIDGVSATSGTIIAELTGISGTSSTELYEDDGITVATGNFSEGVEYVFVATFDGIKAYPAPKLEIKSVNGISVSGLSHTR